MADEEQPNIVVASVNPARHRSSWRSSGRRSQRCGVPRQAEAQFRRGNVLDACLRADYLIASLLPATLKSVRDILTNAAADDDTVHERL